MRTRYVVWAVALLVPAPTLGQEVRDWRVPFAEGQEALEAGDHERYARAMAQTVDLLPAKRLNRPFVQYHAARAAALLGDASATARFLDAAWTERIEALMISFAEFDAAFDRVRDDPAVREVMGRAEALELSITWLGGSVYLLEGAGPNVVAQLGPEGTFLVDTGYRSGLSAVRSALERIGGDDVRQLLITHAHEDHMGSAAELGASALVMAHPATATAMEEPYEFIPGVELPPKSAAARPDALIASDTTFMANGERVRIVPLVAHTDGDLAIYFTESRVAHMGDAYLPSEPVMFPGREDPDAFLDRVEAFLRDMHPDAVVVGGHEERADPAIVLAQVEATRTYMTFVRGVVVEGLAPAAIVERAEQQGYVIPWIAFFYQIYSQPEG